MSLFRCRSCTNARSQSVAAPLWSWGFVHNWGTCEVQGVHLSGAERPPVWDAKLNIEAKFVFHNVKTLFNIAVPCFASENGNQQSAYCHSLGSGVVRQPCNPEEWALTLSTPERAILEMLDEVTQPEALCQADSVMQRLRNLRPNRLQKMLVECRSVQAKLLFLWFAERHNHEWLKHLDREEIDLRAGDRSSQRGEYDSIPNASVVNLDVE
jgi:transcriptional regulator with AbiEi antitoxin domain of type IV toxin-antitoxin system